MKPDRRTKLVRQASFVGFFGAVALFVVSSAVTAAPPPPPGPVGPPPCPVGPPPGGAPAPGGPAQPPAGFFGGPGGPVGPGAPGGPAGEDNVKSFLKPTAGGITTKAGGTTQFGPSGDVASAPTFLAPNPPSEAAVPGDAPKTFLQPTPVSSGGSGGEDKAKSFLNPTGSGVTQE